MPTNNKLSSSLPTEALRKHILDSDLSFLLGNTDAGDLNTINSNIDVPRVANVALSISKDEVKKVIHFNNGQEQMFKVGSDQYYGYYYSGTENKNVDRKGQSHFVIKTPHGEFLALILGYYGSVKCNKAKLGSIIPKRGLTEGTDGKIYVNEDGIAFTVVQKNNDIDGNLSRSFLEVVDSKTQKDNLDKYSGTSKKSEAAGICGSGNEMRCGTCCLYNKEAYYDVIQDKTFKSGSLYKCIESKCYECIEYARKLDKKYRFNRWTSTDDGLTGGTGEGCFGCTDNVGTEDCGPCACSIPMGEDWYINETLGNKNINPASTLSKNAQLEKYSLENLDRCITSIWFNQSGTTKLQRKLNPSYTGSLNVPLNGDAVRDAEITFATETDGDGNKYLVGVEFPGYGTDEDGNEIWNGGQGYSRVSLNTTTMSTMFPDLPLTDEGGISRFEINVSPVGGFAGNQDKLFPTKILIAKTVNMNDIEDFDSFNTYGIGHIVDTEGISIMSDVDYNQPTKTVKLTTEIELQESGGGALSSEVPVKGGGVTPGGGALLSGTTAVSYSDPLVAQFVVDSSTLKSQIATKKPDQYQVGQTLTDQEDNIFNITSVTKPETNGNEVDLNSTLNKIEFVNSTNITKTGDARNSSARFFIIMGSG